MTSRSSLRYSLRLRLPLLVSLLVMVVLAAFLWTVARALNQTLMQTAGVRLQTAADQLATLLSQGAVRLHNEARRVAAESAVRQFLRDPSGPSTDVQTLLSALTASGQPPVELWDAAGGRLLQVASATKPAGQVGAGSLPQGRGVSGYQVRDGVLFYEILANVQDEPGTAVGERAPRSLGAIVVRRTLTNPQASEAINRLIGGNATVAIGNQSGDVWSNFSNVQPAPLVSTNRRGTDRYRTAAGEDRVGALSLVAETPWAIWVESPERVVLEPARALLLRMVALAALFVVLAAAMAAIISARITTPLHELTRASEDIAAGEFSRRVRADRRDEIGRLGAAFNAMVAHVAEAHQTLEARVADRTAGLEQVNQELEAFSYSVSHDLRAPLRHVIGFAALLEQSAASLAERDRRYLSTIVAAARRMGQLIDDLLAFSRVSRLALAKHRVDLTQLVVEVQRELASDAAASRVSWRLHPLPIVEGDRALLRLVFVNLISNALKYSSTRAEPQIEIGTAPGDGSEIVIFVRDNGVGFDMAYADKLFGVFQRLHRDEEFEGTGIGLANVRRIIQRHGGRTWAEAAVDQGATFSFSLPSNDARERRTSAN